MSVFLTNSESLDDSFNSDPSSAGDQVELDSTQLAEMQTKARFFYNVLSAAVRQNDNARAAADRCAPFFLQFDDVDTNNLENITKYPVLKIFAECLYTALTDARSKDEQWQTALRVLGYLNGLTRQQESLTVTKITEFIVMKCCSSAQDQVRSRAVWMLGLLLGCVAETMSVEVELERDEDKENGQTLSNLRNSPGDNLLDTSQATQYSEDLEMLADLAPETHRAIVLLLALSQLRFDESAEVRCAVIEALSRAPDIKVNVQCAQSELKNMYPNEIIIELLWDPDPDVRAIAALKVALVNEEVTSELLSVLEVETEFSIQEIILDRFEKDLALHSIKEKQIDRLLNYLFSEEHDAAVFMRLTIKLFRKWLRDSATKNSVNFYTALDFCDPLENEELALKVFLATALVIQHDFDGEKTCHAWMLSLAKSTGTSNRAVLTKDELLTVLKNVNLEDLRSTGQQLFLHRCLMEFFQRYLEPAAFDDVSTYFLPELKRLAFSVYEALFKIQDILKVDETERIKRELEFIISQMFALLRFADEGDVISRAMWKQVIINAIDLEKLYSGNDMLCVLLSDLVHMCPIDEIEKTQFVDELAYHLNIFLTGDESYKFDDDCIELRNVPRCALIVDSLLRSCKMTAYSVVLKALLMRVAQIATSHQRCSVLGCRIITMAACHDDDVFFQQAHVLAVLPRELEQFGADSVEPTIACLEGIADIIRARGFRSTAKALYADLDDDALTTPEEQSEILSRKCQRIYDIYKNAIFHANPRIAEAAKNCVLKIMCTAEEWHPTLGAFCLLAAFAKNAESSFRKEFVDCCVHFPNSTIHYKIFIASAAVKALEQHAESSVVGSCCSTKIPEMLAFCLDVIRENADVSKISQTSAKVEIGFVISLLLFSKKHRSRVFVVDTLQFTLQCVPLARFQSLKVDRVVSVLRAVINDYQSNFSKTITLVRRLKTRLEKTSSNNNNNNDTPRKRYASLDLSEHQSPIFPSPKIRKKCPLTPQLSS